MEYSQPSEIVKDLSFGTDAKGKIMAGVDKLADAVKVISSELSADIAAAYYKVVTEVFNEIARQEMISPREAWQQFVKTKAMKNVPESDYQAFQDILRGARVPTVQEVLDSKNAYGYLPCYDAFKEWTKNNVPKKLTDAYQLMGI